MSCIVAYKTNENILLAADTQVTYGNHALGSTSKIVSFGEDIDIAGCGSSGVLDNFLKDPNKAEILTRTMLGAYESGKGDRDIINFCMNNVHPAITKASTYYTEYNTENGYTGVDMVFRIADQIIIYDGYGRFSTIDDCNYKLYTTGSGKEISYGAAYAAIILGADFTRIVEIAINSAAKVCADVSGYTCRIINRADYEKSATVTD